MQLGFPFLLHQRLHCGFALQQYESTGRKRPPSPDAALSVITINYNVQMQSKMGCLVDLNVFIGVRVVQLRTSSFQDKFITVAVVKDFNHILNEFLHLLLHKESSLLHSYVTEDHSKCSFRLSAGGGPRHLACVDGGGGSQ